MLICFCYFLFFALKVICIADVKTLYRVPLLLEEAGIFNYLSSQLHLSLKSDCDHSMMVRWRDLTERYYIYRERFLIHTEKKHTSEIHKPMKIIQPVLVEFVTLTKLRSLSIPAAPAPRPMPKTIPTRTTPPIIATVMMRVFPPAAFPDGAVRTSGLTAYGVSRSITMGLIKPLLVCRVMTFFINDFLRITHKQQALLCDCSVDVDEKNTVDQ